MPTPEEIAAALDTERRIAVPAALIRLLGLREAVVLQQIRWHVDRFGVADITGSSLAAEIGITEAQVKPALQRLISEGVLSFSNPDPFSRRRLYRIAPVDGSESSRPEGRESSRQDGIDRARLPIESDLEEVQKKDMATDVAVTVLLRFDAFWEQYPKSRRRERANCLTLYTKATKKDLEGTARAITLGLDRWLTYWKQAETEERFITTSIVWLRNRRWEDDPTLSRQNGTGKPSRQYAPDSPLMRGASNREGESGVW